jgi:hypothetical protein
VQLRSELLALRVKRKFPERVNVLIKKRVGFVPALFHFQLIAALKPQARAISIDHDTLSSCCSAMAR